MMIVMKPTATTAAALGAKTLARLPVASAAAGADGVR